MTIDDIDLRILDMLQRNGKLSQAKIAGAVGLTTSSVNERIKKMERHGMIKGFVALLDHEKMGFPLTAYVRRRARASARFEKGFVDDLEKLLGVQECHYLAGEYSYRLKVKAAGTAALADSLQRRLLSIKGVTRARTQVSLASKRIHPSPPRHRNGSPGEEVAIQPSAFSCSSFQLSRAASRPPRIPDTCALRLRDTRSRLKIFAEPMYMLSEARRRASVPLFRASRCCARRTELPSP